jgi:hypothetical protein
LWLVCGWFVVGLRLVACLLACLLDLWLICGWSVAGLWLVSGRFPYFKVTLGCFKFTVARGARTQTNLGCVLAPLATVNLKHPRVTLK